jgi:Flp pilus assembly pilin Flp
MNTIRKMYVKVQNMRRGQTMTEYALILAAVAVVVFITYEVMGQDIANSRGLIRRGGEGT